MRKKELGLVITFPTTTAAIAAEKICKELQLPERLIPIPQEVSAGCGLAWKGRLADREQLLDAFRLQQIKIEGVHEMLV